MIGKQRPRSFCNITGANTWSDSSGKSRRENTVTEKNSFRPSEAKRAIRRMISEQSTAKTMVKAAASHKAYWARMVQAVRDGKLKEAD